MQLDEAIKEIEKAIKIKPEQFQAYALLAQVAADQKNLKEATALITKAIELKPNQPILYRVRGKLYQDARDNEAALRDYDEAIARDESQGSDAGLRPRGPRRRSAATGPPYRRDRSL